MGFSKGASIPFGRGWGQYPGLEVAAFITTRSRRPRLPMSSMRSFGISMEQAAERPESFSIRERDICRVNLQRFPYQFLFRIASDVVRILVVRHYSINAFSLRRFFAE
jgi:hypothetical protein